MMQRGEAEPVWQTIVPDKPLLTWIEAWRTLTGQQPVLIASHGSPTAGIAPIEGSIWVHFAQLLESHLKRHTDTDLIIRVRGGNLAYLRDVVEVVLQPPGHIHRSLVLDWATSAGTVLALSCGKITMPPQSYVSPISPQISLQDDAFPRASTELLRFLENNPDLGARSLGEIRQLTVAEQWTSELHRWLQKYGESHSWSVGQTKKLIETFTNWQRPHDSHLYRSDLKELDFLVSESTTDEANLLRSLETLLGLSAWSVLAEGLLLHTVIASGLIHRCLLPATT